MKRIYSKAVVGALLACVWLTCFASAASADTYKKDVAVNYARSYATFYNWNFPSYPSDCTNFVSQALAVGWSSFRYNSNPDWAWFYQGQWNCSRSWINAHTLFNFLQNTGRGYVIGEGVTSNPGRYNDLEPGDLIFASWHDTGWMDHVMIVTGRDARGILISAHTTNHKDFPFCLTPLYRPNGTNDIMHETNLGRFGRYYYIRMRTQY